jgi:hypothetical protein
MVRCETAPLRFRYDFAFIAIREGEWRHLMKRCQKCGRRFSLVRYRYDTLRFCTERCLEAWKRAQIDKARQQRFLQWLSTARA